jgi:elongation factor P--(R)-beta-lysine ligase
VANPLASPWWTPDVHADRRPFLLARARITAAVRSWFERQSFVEVETPILQASPGNETHLHAFATEITTPGGERSRLYLHTSPEFACKKLLAAGEQRLFALARVFRNRERGALHHPEFTMLEWYRAQQPYRAMMDDCMALIREAARAAGAPAGAPAGARLWSFAGRTADPNAAPELLSVAEAFAQFAGIDLLATLSGALSGGEPASAGKPAPGALTAGKPATGGEPDAAALAAAARAAGIRTADDDTWSDIFSRILVEKVEPRLGNGRPTILFEYPMPEAALARPAADPRVAERFEIFVCGVELANGFGELTDAAEQRARFAHAMAEKERIYGERYPVDEDFLAALKTMPPASGVALGFDRLVMLATGAARIEQVLWGPVVDS